MNNTTVFSHEQSTPSANWNIVHNLNSFVVCNVVVLEESSYVQILPKAVKKVSLNEVQVQFSNARTGVARIIGPLQPVYLKSPGSIDPGQSA